MSSAELESIDPSLALIFPLDESADHYQLDGHRITEKETLDANAAWKFYSHSIRRNPTDLKLHTHRVFFAMQHKNADFLAGSLHDLFYILKDAGKNLRVRLLKACMPYLSKQEVLYFAMWIKTGIKKGMGYKWVNGSVLSDGLFGPDNVLIKMNKRERSSIELSPIEEARDLMESGQLDKAQQVLEEALAEDENNQQLLEELEYLMRYNKSTEITPSKHKQSSIVKMTLNKWKEKLLLKKEYSN